MRGPHLLHSAENMNFESMKNKKNLIHDFDIAYRLVFFLFKLKTDLPKT